MLDTATKRRIDTARDILVGRVPDPKSQVEQITIALIYKFMDDMDAESEEMGGQRKFFADGFSRYGWAKLMSPGLGGHEMLGLYGEGISKMPENPGIPLLFRDIFKNAYLPYRDPETLRSFLKIIDEFSYDHSERLGDAFEYLLSVLGSQGDAGQFRTPRHIIDFMVEIMDPKKTETVLDPACGTAGFLISSYKHILKANRDDKGQSTLTPDERGRLAKNIYGYDISPDMVRLSLVNLYLHGFTDPHIHEYDTLTSEDRWNQFADVIMANPPFMSPKGGIKPHNRFSVQSKRSEVLFVDYMAEHLTPNGRAAIIVPEGIIFQSQGSYTELRRMLVENSLVAVISLPAGVFNPYSGVKTSILILDKALARESDSIAFFKVENDGFGLGAQRKPSAKNDLSQVRTELNEFTRVLREGSSIDELTSTVGHLVAKHKIAANGDYSLSGERYRAVHEKLTTFALRPLGELLVEMKAGFASGQSGVDVVGVPHLRPMNITSSGGFTLKGVKQISEEEYAGRSEYALRPGDILFNNTNSKELIGKTCLITDEITGGFSNHLTRLRVDTSLCVPEFVSLVLHDAWRRGMFLTLSNKWIGQAGINTKALSAFEIPVPPLDVQKELVTEVVGYQRVVSGAQAVLDSYRPHIPVHPDWKVFNLSEVAEKVTDGAHFTPTYVENGVPFLRVTDITESSSSKKFIPIEEHLELIKRCRPEKGDVLYSKNGTIGIAKLVDWDWDFSIFVSLALIKPKRDLIDPHYLTCFLNSDAGYTQATARSKSGTVTNLHLIDIKTIKIPVPPLETQRTLVSEVEAEQALVAANRELIDRFERKVRDTLARIWGAERHSLIT